MRIARWMISVWMLASAGLVIRPVAAGVVDTPSCRADLARADELIHGIRLREGRIKRDDMPTACRLLRQNLQDMTAAGKLMEPCLTGHDKGENLGQIWASAGDIRGVISRHCS